MHVSGVGRGGSVVGSVPCVRKVSGSNPTSVQFTYEVTYYTRLVHCSLSWLNGRRYQEMVLQQRWDDALSLSLSLSLSLLCTFALL